MKYAIVIPDGCADEPLAELNGRTPLDVLTEILDAIPVPGATGPV